MQASVRRALSPEVATIDPERCRQLLRRASVGRVAIVADDQLDIIPVSYVFDGKAVLFATEPGAMIAEPSLQHAAFEIDAIDETSRSGWTVSVHGYGRRLAQPRDHHRFEILAEEITGRRLAA